MTLKVEEKVFEILFSKINWNSIFKEGNDLINAIVRNFFDSVSSTAMHLGEYIVMRPQLDQAKFFVDISIQHMKSQLERAKRQYANYASVLPSTNALQSGKPKLE